MQLSYAVLLLIGDASAKNHYQRSNEPVRPSKDIIEKSVNPWVYSKVYDAVNPLPLSRTAEPGAKDTYTPHGNPYWPSKKEEAPAATIPTELMPKSFSQV
jgi:hypothetical protein